MKKLLPILLIILGIGGGAGAGLMLRPKHAEVAINPCGDGTAVAHAEEEEHPAEEAPPEEPSNLEYVKMNNQFIVPVVEGERVAALVAISLSLEADPGQQQFIYQREPKLRDAFLQVMFDHSNVGGFSGAFTESANLMILRRELLAVAKQNLGPIVKDVLITDIARQDS